MHSDSATRASVSRCWRHQLLLLVLLGWSHLSYVSGECCVQAVMMKGIRDTRHCVLSCVVSPAMAAFKQPACLDTMAAPSQRRAALQWVSCSLMHGVQHSSHTCTHSSRPSMHRFTHHPVPSLAQQMRFSAQTNHVNNVGGGGRGGHWCSVHSCRRRRQNEQCVQHLQPQP